MTTPRGFIVLTRAFFDYQGTMTETRLVRVPIGQLGYEAGPTEKSFVLGPFVEEGRICVTETPEQIDALIVAAQGGGSVGRVAFDRSDIDGLIRLYQKVEAWKDADVRAFNDALNAALTNRRT